ncbi:MAG: hypothetical protein JRI72_00485 [Deltaproteobacteria bacterium]|nr:hypothetical protein [Deltaproteobacteria bacterium]
MKKPTKEESAEYEKLARKRAELQLQIQSYRQSNRIEFFDTPPNPGPNPLQAELLDAWLNPNLKVFTYTGANRIGKTVLLTLIGFSVMFGKFLWNNTKLHFRHTEPRKVRIIGQDWEKHVKSVLIPELWKWWPKSRKLKTKKNNQGVEALWTDEKTGSTLEIMSNLQESALHEGWSGDLVCIEENQRVLMGNGIWKPIKDICVGEEVWTTCGGHVRSKHKVLNVIDNGFKKIVRVVLRGGITLLCTPDHEIYIRANKNNNPRDKKKAACRLTGGDKVYCPLVEIDDTNRNDFYKLFKFLLFFVGAWIGDGWSDKKRVFLASASDEFLDYVRDGLLNGYKLVHCKKYDYEIQPSNGILYQLLNKLGLTGKKAYEKFIPDEIFTLCKDEKIEFIKGLLATDGWAIKSCIGYGSTSERLVRDFHKLLRSLGIHSTIQFKKSQKVGVWRDQWFLNISKSGSVARLIDLLQFVPGKNLAVALEGANQRYLGKINRCSWGVEARSNLMPGQKNHRRGIQYHKVKSVEPAGVARVYDLTIEGNHNFICECMQVSNCYDEPPKRDVRVANARGLIDRNGRELFCMTLLKEAWVDREVIKKTLDDGRPDPSVFNVTGDIWSNVGYGINEEGVEQYKSLLNEDEIEARIHGIPSYMSGLIYPQYNRKTHLVERFQIPLDWMVDIAIDVHPRKKQAILFIATDPRNDRYVCEEIWDHGDAKWIAEAILRSVNYHSYRVNRVIIDPLAKGDSNNPESMYEIISRILMGKGIILETATKDKEQGILEVKKHLMGPNKKPSIFFFNDLIRTIREIEGYMWDENTQKVSKDEDDMMENLYRLCLLNTKWEEPAPFFEYDEPRYAYMGRDAITGY